jgi:hypothetical protein
LPVGDGKAGLAEDLTDHHEHGDSGQGNVEHNHKEEPERHVR